MHLPRRSALSSWLLFVILAALRHGLSAAEAPPQQIAAPAKHNYVPGQLLVAFRPGTESFQRSQLHELNGMRLIHRNRSLNLDLVETTRGDAVDVLVEHYSGDPVVLFAEPNYYFGRAAATPDDTFFQPQQWALNNTSQTGGTTDADIDAPEAWDTRHDCSPVIVAVMDTGINYTHPDLAPNIWSNPLDDCGDSHDDDGNDLTDDCRGWNWVDGNNDVSDHQGHGTHVAGIIGARGGNAKGVAGVCWAVKLMALKVFDTGQANSGALSDAIEYAVDHGARVINFSASDHMQPTPASVRLALRYAKEHTPDVLFVTAAGAPIDGNGLDVDLTEHWYPCYAIPGDEDLTNILCVTSTDHNDAKEHNANWGATSVDLAAPGVAIRSTGIASAAECGTSPITDTDGSIYTLCTGTSMATPHVSGAAALLFAQRTSSTVSNVKWSILSSVNLISLPGTPIVTGGRLNLASAVTALGDLVPPAAPSTFTATAVSTASAQLNWSAATDNIGVHHYEVFRKDSVPLNSPAKLVATLSPSTLSYTDSGLTPDRAYLYTVFAVDAAGNRSGKADVATTRIVAAVAAGTPISAADLNNLRDAIKRVQTLAGQSATCCAGTVSPDSPIVSLRFTDMRTQLDTALGALGLPTGGYTDTLGLNVAIRAIHFNDLQKRIQ